MPGNQVLPAGAVTIGSEYFTVRRVISMEQAKKCDASQIV
jgi:hypothetical protein